VRRGAIRNEESQAQSKESDRSLVLIVMFCLEPMLLRFSYKMISILRHELVKLFLKGKARSP
jgi:hypothetical protein